VRVSGSWKPDRPWLTAVRATRSPLVSPSGRAAGASSRTMKGSEQGSSQRPPRALWSARAFLAWPRSHTSSMRGTSAPEVDGHVSWRRARPPVRVRRSVPRRP
jgi:hypothetical protein